jgi:hypothetical protein
MWLCDVLDIGRIVVLQVVGVDECVRRDGRRWKGGFRMPRTSLPPGSTCGEGLIVIFVN